MVLVAASRTSCAGPWDPRVAARRDPVARDGDQIKLSKVEFVRPWMKMLPEPATASTARPTASAGGGPGSVARSGQVLPILLGTALTASAALAAVLYFTRFRWTETERTTRRRDCRSS